MTPPTAVKRIPVFTKLDTWSKNWKRIGLPPHPPLSRFLSLSLSHTHTHKHTRTHTRARVHAVWWAHKPTFFLVSKESRVKWENVENGPLIKTRILNCTYIPTDYVYWSATKVWKQMENGFGWLAPLTLAYHDNTSVPGRTADQGRIITFIQGQDVVISKLIYRLWKWYELERSWKDSVNRAGITKYKR